MQKIILVTTMLIALIINSCALPEEPETEIKPIKEIKVVESYSCETQICDLTDDDNYIWCAKKEGVVRINKITNEKKLYDKSNSPFTEPCYEVATDKDNTVWIVDSYGKIYYKYQEIETWQELPKPQQISSYPVLLTDSQNSLVCLFGEVVYKYQNAVWKQITYGLKVRNLTIDKNDNLWFTTIDSLSHLYKYDNNSIINYSLPDSIKKDYITNIAVDNNLNIVLTSIWHGVAIFNQSDWIIYNTSNSALPSNCFYKIDIDQDNNIWLLPSSNYGLTKLKPTGEVLVYDYTFEPLKDFDLDFIHIDRSNRLILASRTPEDCQDLITMTNDNWTKSSSRLNPLPRGFTEVLSDNSNNTWVGGAFGITKIKDNEWKFYSLKDLDSSITGYWLINSIAEDNNNNIWFGSNHGVFRYNNYDDVLSIYNQSNSPIPENERCFVSTDNSNLIVGCENSIQIFDGNTWRIINTADFNNEFIAKGRFDYYSLHNDYAFTISPNDYSSPTITRLDSHNSPLSKIGQIAMDNNDNPWFVTTKDGYQYLYEYSGNFYRYDWTNIGFNQSDSHNYYLIRNDKRQGLSVFNSKFLAKRRNNNWQLYTFYPQNGYSYYNLCWQNSKTLWLTDGNRLFKAEVQE